jgi:hypothetical protein
MGPVGCKSNKLEYKVTLWSSILAKNITRCGTRTHDHQLKRLALYQTELTGSYDFNNEIAKYKHQLILEYIKTALYTVGDERQLSLDDKTYLY